MQKGQAQEAIAPLRQAVSLDSSSGRAHYQLGLALSRRSKSEEGKQELEKGLSLIQADENNRKANSLIAKAKMEIEHGETQQAIETLGKVITLMPDYAEGHSLLAQALTKLGDLEGSIAEFKRAVALDPKLYSAQLGLGEALRSNGQLVDAGNGFREAVRLRPDSAEAYYDLGSALSALGDKNGAAAAFQKVLELDPGNAAAQESLHAIANASSSAKPARTGTGTSDLLSAPVTSAGDLHSPSDSDDVDQIQSFEILVQREKWDEVQPLLVSYLAEHANSWRVHYIQGYVLFRIHKVGDSIRELAKSLELNTNNAEGHKILGKDFVVIGKYDYAQTELEQAARLAPDSAEIHYSLGEVYSVRDMFREAKPEFLKATQLDPKYAEGYNALGFTEESLSNDTAALAAYETAIRVAQEKGSKFEAPYVNLSAFYNRLLNPELALQYAQKAIELNPNSDLAFYQRARAYQFLKNWELAAEALRAAISIKPSYEPEESRGALDTFQKLKHDSEVVENQIRDAHHVSEEVKK